MELILDNSALIAWERAENAGQSLALDANQQLVMPTIVWAGALAGIRVADSAPYATRRMARIEAILGPRGGINHASHRESAFSTLNSHPFTSAFTELTMKQSTKARRRFREGIDNKLPASELIKSCDKRH